MNGHSVLIDDSAPPSRWRFLILLGRVVWLEARRKNALTVFGVLLGLYLLGALVLQLTGVDSPATARFVRGLGLHLGGLIAPLLVIVMGARQVPGELELRTIYPILAKPVGRGQFLAGKALPTAIVGVGALWLFAVVTLAVTPGLPQQRAVVLCEALAARSVGLAALTALTIWLSLCVPSGVAMLLAGAFWFIGGPVINITAQAGADLPWLGMVLCVWPDFSLFDHLQRYVDGGAPLSPGVLAGLAGYGASWTAFFGLLAAGRFRRIAL